MPPSLKSAVLPLLLSVRPRGLSSSCADGVGAANWRQPGPALARETVAMLALFDELGLRCTPPARDGRPRSSESSP